MLKIVIIEPDVQKQGQIRQTLEQELVSWLEPNFFYVPKVVSEVDFASSLEDYLECQPEEVYHLENLSVNSFKADLKRNDVPDWIRLNTHFLGDEMEDAPDIVITKNEYNDDDFLLYNIPFLKKKGSVDRYIFFQAADGDHVSLLKKCCYFLHGSPVLTYLLTDDSLQTLPTNEDGMCNYLPYAWKSHFPDHKAHVIVRLNAELATLGNVEELAANENLYLQYDKLDAQAVQNLRALFTRLEGKWIHLYRDKFPDSEKHMRLTAQLLALIEEAGSISAGLSQISMSLSSRSSSKLICTLDLPCNQPSGAAVQQSQRLKIEEWQVVINYHAEQPMNVASLIKFEEAVKAWAQVEFELYLRANADLIASINGVLRGNAERLGQVINAISKDLGKSSLNDDFKRQHIKALEYILQKFNYIAGFTNCCASGAESWQEMTIGDIVNNLKGYQHVFQCLDDSKKINVSIEADDETKKVWLPNNGIYCMTNILEAVIRNTLKHEKHSNVYNFKLKIKGGVCQFFWEDSDSTTGGMDAVRQSLNNPLLLDDLHIDNTSLGLKELRASMRFLYEGILSFFGEDSACMSVDPADAIVKIDNGWGYQFKLRTSKPDEPPQHIRKKRDALREANLVALSAIMARNFSHNIGSHALLALISKVTGEVTNVVDEEKKILNNLKTVYEYIRNKADFLSSFAFAGEGIVLHSESIYDVQEEYKKYAYVFSQLASGASGLNVCFCNVGETFSEENDLRISLPESGIFAFFNLMEILLCQSKFTGKDCWLYLQFLSQNAGMEVYMIWMKEALMRGELYQNKEIQDVALYLQGIAPWYWSEKRDRAVWGELSSMAFKLQKAKDFFFVVNEDDKKKVNGFDCESIGALQKKLEEGLVIPHEFLIFVDISAEQQKDFWAATPKNQLPLRIIDMESKDINNELELTAKAWKNYAEQHLFNERLLDPENINSEEYELVKINGKVAYSGNHGLGNANDSYYYNEGVSSEVQRHSPLFPCTHSHKLIIETTRKIKKPDIWKEYMSPSEINKWFRDKFTIFDYTTLPVVIFDERIQGYGNKENLYDRWNKMHIYVPEVRIYGKLNETEELDKVVRDYLEIVCAQLNNVGLRSDCSAVVFHESLLYPWLEKQGRKINDYLKEFRENFPNTHVYLMTGRGKAQYTKTDDQNLVRFVQFTPIDAACKDFNKFKMYNLLISARK